MRGARRWFIETRLALRDLRVMYEDVVLKMVEIFQLEPFLNWVLDKAEALLGKAVVIEAERETIKAFIRKGLDEDEGVAEEGNWISEEDWYGSHLDNEDFDDGIPWGDYPPDWDPREEHLRDPDNREDR